MAFAEFNSLIQRPADLQPAPDGREWKHDVAFYENDFQLYQAVSRFFAPGIKERKPLIVIATPEHREAIAALLQTEGMNVAAAIKNGGLTLLDAGETLSTFMKDAMPDAELFERHIGRVIEGSLRAAEGQSVLAFGEMVDVLWRGGNRKAAIRLEQLWNNLSKKYSFSLFCAYAIGNFPNEADCNALSKICGQHRDVSMVGTNFHDSRLNEVVFFKQQTRVLEREIEHRKELEAQYERVLSSERQALNEAQAQIERRDEFIALLSHELLTPLSAILGYANLIKSGKLEPAKLGQAIDSIERNARWQCQLLHDLRDLARMRAGTFQIRYAHLILPDIIPDVVDALSPRAEAKRIRIDLDLNPMNGDVWGDEVRMRQVISNLLTNAIKFTPEDGSVVVRLEQRGTRAELQFIDNGKGISSEFLPYVFDRFRQEHPRNEGLGLGLAIVKHIVEMHGGTITAASDGQGRGSVFRIQFPLVATIPTGSLDYK